LQIAAHLSFSIIHRQTNLTTKHIFLKRKEIRWRNIKLLRTSMIPLESRSEKQNEKEQKQRKNKKDHHASAKQLPQFTTGLHCLDRHLDIPAAQCSLLFLFSFSFFFFCCIFLSPLFGKVNNGERLHCSGARPGPT